MVHKLTALIFLIAVAGSTFNKTIALIDYSLNKNFIATQLCENRNIPMSCCRGKCFLKKQLQKEESNKNTNSSSRQEEVNIQWYCEESLQTEYSFSKKDLLFYDYSSNTCSVLLPAVFHPPGQI